MAPNAQKRQNGKVRPFPPNLKYVEDFKIWVYVAGRLHRIPEKEIAKCYVSGLKPAIFREEMNSRTFENLDDVVREVSEELSTYRDIVVIYGCRQSS